MSTAITVVPQTPRQASTLATLSTLNKTPFAKSSAALSVRLAQQWQLAAKLQQTKTLPVEQLAAYGTAMQDLEGVVPGVTSGVLLAVSGFESGDELSGFAGIMDACASMAPLVGTIIGAGIGSFIEPGGGTALGAALGGIVGAIVGSFFTMIAEVLGYFVPTAQTHAENLSKELRAMKVSEVQVEIWAAHNQITVYASSLQDACNGIDAGRYNPRVMTEIIRGLNPIEGTTMKTYWEVIGWLGVPGNEKDPKWPTILNAACNAYTALLTAVMRLMAVVNTDAMAERFKKAYEKRKSDPIQGEKEIAQLDELADVAKAKLIAFGWCNNLQRVQLENMRTAVQNWGTLWFFAKGHDLVERVVFDADPKTTDLKTPIHLRLAYKTMSVTAGAKEQSAMHPNYQVYGLRRDSLDLQHFTLEYNPDSTKYVRGGIHTFPEVRPEDIFVTPAAAPDAAASKTQPNAGNDAYVYELNRVTTGPPPHHSFITALRRGPDGASKGIFDSIHLGDFNHYANSVRAVHHPYSYPDDRADGSLQDVSHIVYASAPTGILVFARDINKTPYKVVSENYVESPLSGLKGIGVDQDYLWVFSATEFACATHSEVVRALKATPRPKEVKAGDILWIKSKINPDWGELISLYPCDDGTLVASAKHTGPKKDTNQLHYAPYEIDLLRYTISIGEWAEIKDSSGHSFEKLPVACWPQFESLTETLKALEPALSPKSLPRIRTDVWGIDKDNKVYRWNGQTGDKAHFDSVDGQPLTSIAVGDGDVWGLNNKDIYRWNGKSGTEALFRKVEGEFTSIVVVGREVWGVRKTAQDAYRWNECKWVEYKLVDSTDPSHSNLASIAVGGEVPGKQLEVWGLRADLKVFRWNGKDKFDVINPADKPHAGLPFYLNSIAVGDGKVWRIYHDKVYYNWDGKLGTEARFEKIDIHLTSIAADGREVWGLNNKDIYRWNGKSGSEARFDKVDGALTSIAVGDGEVWGRIDNGTIFRWNGTKWEEVAGLKFTSIAVGR